MARRSYLERIAEPLPPGEPVLFAVPRPAVDEARPAAAPRAQTAPAPAAPAATPSLRRAAAGNALAAVPGSLTAAAAAPAAPAATPSLRRVAASNALVAVPGSLTAAPPLAATRSSSAPASPVFESAPIAPPPVADAPAMRAEPPDFSEPTQPSNRALEIGPPLDAVSRVVADPPPFSFRAEPSPQVLPPAAKPASASSKPTLTAAAAVPIVRAADPIPSQLPPAAVLSLNISQAESPNSSGAAPPRIHIGTIEVRTSPPPAPVPPPSPTPLQPASHAPPGGAAAQFSRAYSWRFGLIQG